MSLADVLATRGLCHNVSGSRWVALQDARYYNYGFNLGYTSKPGSYLGCSYISQMLIMDGEQTETIDFDTCDPYN